MFYCTLKCSITLKEEHKNDISGFYICLTVVSVAEVLILQVKKLSFLTPSPAKCTGCYNSSYWHTIIRFCNQCRPSDIVKPLSACTTLPSSNHALGDTARPFALHEDVTGLKDHVMQGKVTPQNKMQLRLCVMRRMGRMMSIISNSKTLLLLPDTHINPLEVLFWGPGLRHSTFSAKIWSPFC